MNPRAFPDMLRHFQKRFTQADRWIVKTIIRLVRGRKVPEVNLEKDLRMIRPGLGLVFALVVVGVIGYVGYWLLYVGPKQLETNTSRLTTAPTAIATPPERTLVDPWANHTWLSQGEAQALRTQQNVINWAILANGSARYSPQTSFTFTGKDPWSKTVPYYVKSIGIQGTAVQIEANGFKYYLNAYQPFSFEDEPSHVYVIDGQGQFWMAEDQKIKEVPITEAFKALVSIIVSPNPNLNLTYGR